MVATTIQDILLIALAKAYAGQANAHVMLEQIGSAARKLEQADPQLPRLSARTTGALIDLDNQKLIRIDRGRVWLTPAGSQACQDLELPPAWSGLPGALKRYIRN